jgi:hypothetical protein
MSYTSDCSLRHPEEGGDAMIQTSLRSMLCGMTSLAIDETLVLAVVVSRWKGKSWGLGVGDSNSCRARETPFAKPVYAGTIVTRRCWSEIFYGHICTVSHLCYATKRGRGE